MAEPLDPCTTLPHLNSMAEQSLCDASLGVEDSCPKAKLPVYLQTNALPCSLDALRNATWALRIQVLRQKLTLYYKHMP